MHVKGVTICNKLLSRTLAAASVRELGNRDGPLGFRAFCMLIHPARALLHCMQTCGSRAGLGFVLKTVNNNVWIKPTVSKPHFRSRPAARCQHVHSRRHRETNKQ